MGFRCSPSALMRSRSRISRSSSCASCRIRHPRSTSCRSLREGITQRKGGRPLEVSPTPAPEKVEQDEPAEKEQRDDEKEPYDAHEQVECVQGSPFKRCRRAVQPQAVGTAGFEPATTRPPAECATRLRHVPTRLYSDPDHTRRRPCYHATFVVLAA